MKYLTTIPKTARRVTAVIAAASVAGLIATTAAFAASSSGAAPTADTTRAASAAVRCLHGEDLGVWVAVTQVNGTAGSIYLAAAVHQPEPARLRDARLPRGLRRRP